MGGSRVFGKRKRPRGMDGTHGDGRGMEGLAGMGWDGKLRATDWKLSYDERGEGACLDL